MFFPEFFQGRSVRAFGKKQSAWRPWLGMLRPPKTMEGTIIYIIWKMYLLPRESSKYSKYARAGNSTIPPPRPPPSMPVTSRRLLMSFIFTRGSKEKPSLCQSGRSIPRFNSTIFSRNAKSRNQKLLHTFEEKYPVPLHPKPFQYLPIIYRQNSGLLQSSDSSRGSATLKGWISEKPKDWPLEAPNKPPVSKNHKRVGSATICCLLLATEIWKHSQLDLWDNFFFFSQK